jgi:predicted HicB family RNase H-like nuclease
MDKRQELEKYLNLDYPIAIEKIAEELGGGYIAYLPDFGKKVIFGDGETEAEALEDLKEFKEFQFGRFVERGMEFPEPKKASESSGKFMLRLPKDLHQQLTYYAKLNDTTLNQYCVHLLSWNCAHSSVQLQLAEMSKDVSRIMFNVSSSPIANARESRGYSLDAFGDAA